MAGMGSAFWAPGNRGKGPPTERAREYLGKGVSNNVTEYKSLVESMTRATRRLHEKEVVFEVDSMLLANHVGHTWACRHPTLAPLYEKCCELGDTLTENEVHWKIRHIYLPRVQPGCRRPVQRSHRRAGATLDVGGLVGRTSNTNGAGERESKHNTQHQATTNSHKNVHSKARKSKHKSRNKQKQKDSEAEH